MPTFVYNGPPTFLGVEENGVVESKQLWTNRIVDLPDTLGWVLRGSRRNTIEPTSAVEPPRLSPIADVLLQVGDPVKIFTPENLGGDTSVVWSSTGLPAGSTIDPNTGEVMLSTSAVVSPVDVTISAENTSGRSSRSFRFGVLAAVVVPPVINPIPDIAGNVNDADFSYTATLANPTAATWSATGFPTGWQINSSSGEITGEFTEIVADTTITVTATNSAGENSVTLQLAIAAEVITPDVVDFKNVTTIPADWTGVNVAYTQNANYLQVAKDDAADPNNWGVQYITSPQINLDAGPAEITFEMVSSSQACGVHENPANWISTGANKGLMYNSQAGRYYYGATTYSDKHAGTVGSTGRLVFTKSGDDLTLQLYEDGTLIDTYTETDAMLEIDTPMLVFDAAFGFVRPIGASYVKA